MIARAGKIRRMGETHHNPGFLTVFVMGFTHPTFVAVVLRLLRCSALRCRA
jgi:hypothetical protein